MREIEKKAMAEEKVMKDGKGKGGKRKRRGKAPPRKRKKKNDSDDVSLQLFYLLIKCNVLIVL